MTSRSPESALPEPADDPPAEEFTIDDLAAATGVPSRTIRFYQSKGALQSPTRRGRVAYYGAEHVERLRVIADLQDRGLRLDAIRDVIESIEQGSDSLQEWLGLGDRLQAPWNDEHPIVLALSELEARAREAGVHRDGHPRPGLLADLERVGLVIPRSDGHTPTYLIPSPGLLDIGLHLEAAGVDVSTGADAQAIIRSNLSRAAQELVDHFSESTGRGFARLGDPSDIVVSLEALRPLGSMAVQLIFGQEIERALRRFVEEGRIVTTSRRVKAEEASGTQRSS